MRPCGFRVNLNRVCAGLFSIASEWLRIGRRGTAGLKLFQWAPPGPPQRPFGYRNATPSHAPFGGCRKAGALEPGLFLPPEGALCRAKTIRDRKSARWTLCMINRARIGLVGTLLTVCLRQPTPVVLVLLASWPAIAQTAK